MTQFETPFDPSLKILLHSNQLAKVKHRQWQSIITPFHYVNYINFFSFFLVSGGPQVISYFHMKETDSAHKLG